MFLRAKTKFLYLFNTNINCKIPTTYEKLEAETGVKIHTLASYKSRGKYLPYKNAYLVDGNVTVSELRALSEKRTRFGEVWVRVKGFDNYEISNYGRLRSYAKSDKPFLMIAFLNRAGYPAIRLKKDGKVYNFMIHRLVADNFLSEDSHLFHFRHKDVSKSKDVACVGHRDGDIYNAHSSNLVWIDSTDLHMIKKKKETPVLKIDATTNKIVDFYDSIDVAARESYVIPDAITNCIKGKTKTSAGFYWAIDNDQDVGEIYNGLHGGNACVENRAYV